MQKLALLDEQINNVAREAAKLYSTFTTYSFKKDTITGQVYDRKCTWTNKEAEYCYNGYKEILADLQQRRTEIIKADMERYVQRGIPLTETEKAVQAAQYAKALIDLGFIDPEHIAYQQ